MLPKDKWDDNKIPLPENDEGAYIAPADLTAILKEPVYFDWDYETNGIITDPPDLVYDEKWVGREIRHFPWSRELFETERRLLRPYGYRIPKKWDKTIDAIKNQYRQKNGTDPSSKELVEILINDYDLRANGAVRNASIIYRGNWGDFGVYWSSFARGYEEVYCLAIARFVLVRDIMRRSSGGSVRCITTPQ